MITLQGIPEYLQNKLFDEYVDVKKRYIFRDWGPGQLKAGRFAEVMLRIFQHLIGETVTPIGSDIPSNEKDRIINILKSSSTIDIHIRQKVAILTRLLLDFRNNRDVAHLGGFNSNHMDSSFVLSCVNWIVSELVRVYGGYSMDQAEKIVSEINIKNYPAISFI